MAVSVASANRPAPWEAWWPYALLLAWPFAILWPAVLHPNDVLMQPHAPFSDLLISHWPNAEWVRRSLFVFQQLPLWNPAILSGAPLAADPLAGLWYLPNSLTVILPLPLAFNLLLAVHLAWAGWGLYQWALRDGFGRGPALVGALAFAAMPKLVDHLAAGHVSLVFAVCWTPWLLLTVDRVPGREAGLRAFLRALTVAAIVWAAVFLADVRWGVMAGGVMVIWWMTGRDDLKRRVGGLGLCILIWLALTAVLWLPLSEFVRLSARAGLTPQESAVFSLPPNYLIGLVVPNLGGFQEYMTYLGLTPLGLAGLGLWGGLRSSQRRTVVMAGLGLGAIWWALGPDAGLFWLASRMPGLALLRVPSRAWFIVGLAVSWLAIRGAAEVAGGWRMHGRGLNLASAAFVGSAWLLAIGGSWAAHKPLTAFITIALALTGLTVGLRVRPALAVLLVVAALELWWVDTSLIEARPVAASPVADWLARQPGVWRVYSPSYSLPQLDAAQASLQQADGINPLQLESTVLYMDSATGVSRPGYSVTTPPFDGDVSTANKAAAPDARRLGALNVRYVVSQFDLSAPGLVWQTTLNGARIYLNTFDAGRVQGGTLVSWSPNRIVLQAAGPGRVTVSEVWYPGWIARVDGRPAVVAAEGLLRSVSISAGSHEVVLEYWPTAVFVGLVVSLLGLSSVALVGWPS